MKKRWKKGVSFFLALAVAAGAFPGSAAAADGAAGVEGGLHDTEQVRLESGTSSSDKSVLKSLNFDLPEDSAYKQDEVRTGTRSVSVMSELLLTKAGETGFRGKTYLYDNDRNQGIQNDLNNQNAVTDSYRIGDYLHPYTITETLDADGDGRKEILVQLYLEDTKRGGRILMKISDIRTKICIFDGEETGGCIVTSDDIPPYGLEGLLCMSAGDFDGDGHEELAVYEPNNRDETPSGSTPDTLNICVYKLNADLSALPSPQQVIPIAKVGGEWGDCQNWLYSHAGSKKQYYCFPYLSMSAGDIDGDGISDLLTVASFSSSYRGAGLKDTFTWKQVIDPNSCFSSVLDVYKGCRQDGSPLEQIVKKRVLIGRDTGNSNDWNKGCGVLRNASVTIANVTGANTNEIVIGGNYTGVQYDSSVTENTTVTKNRYVWVDKSDDPKILVGYVTAQGLLSDNSKAASLTYNWTMQEDGYHALHYYNGDDTSNDPGNEPVELDGFAAYGSGQPDTIAIEGQMFVYSEDEGKLLCSSYVPPDSVGKDKSNVWISAQTVGNVTNDPFGRETLYYTNCQKKSKKETYWNDVVSVWGVVNADGTKGYDGKSMGDGKSGSAMHYTMAMCDIDDDSSLIQYEAGNTDVYYSNVQLLSVLQAAPVYEGLGENYISEAETSYGKSSGSSSGSGHTHEVSGGVVAGFEHETSFLGMTNLFSLEVTAQLSVTAGWEFEKTAEKEFTTSYNTGGTQDVAVIYTVPYVRYNGRIYIPSYTLPTREEYDAKKAFCDELKANIERYQDIKAAVVGGVYAKPGDGWNDAYTTDVTADSYDYQLRTFQNYMQWLQQTESQMEGFEGSKGLSWGQEIEGGWEDYFFCIPQTPMITSVPADTYNEIAAGCEDLQNLYGTALPSGYVAGRPETYAGNLNDLKERTTVDTESVESGKTNAGEDGTLGDGFISSTSMSAASSAPSQTITFTEENAKTTSIGGGVSLEIVATIGQVKGGIAVSTDHAATWSSSTTKGCEFNGQVPNLPECPDYMTQKQYGNYDYAWKLVAYEAKVNGANVPVVGYYTRYADRASIPPSPACNLEAEEVGSDHITLTWNGGSRAADHYNVYEVSGSGTKKEYQKIGTVSASESEDGLYRFAHQGLRQEQTYTYVVAACNADESVTSVYSDEMTATTPVPEFDVQVVLEGIDSQKTYLAGENLSLAANLSTVHYPQSEVDQYIWQINDGSGWRRIPGISDESSYAWQALAELDGCQYRCGAYVAVDNRLYRLYSNPLTLSVRKAKVRMEISADKKEGATDRSSEFGAAVYNGDVLKLSAIITPEEGAKASGSMVFVVKDLQHASNTREYAAAVSEDGTAQAECRFQKAGKYSVSARYNENERIKEAVSENSLSYYAYDSNLADDRGQGQKMEDTIYGQAWDDMTVDHAMENKEQITGVKEEFENLTDVQKDLVETTAKNKLAYAIDRLKAAETVEKIVKIGTVTKENAKEKEALIEDAQKTYEGLTKEQKTLVPETAKKMLEDAAEAYKKAMEPEKKPEEPEKKPDESGSLISLTPEERVQADRITGKLGVSMETAASILKLSKEMEIDMDALLVTQQDILKIKTEQDIKGSKFFEMRAQAAKVSSKQATLSWKQRKGADGYLIYQAECGKKNPYKLVKDIKKGNTKKYTAKKLKKGRSYRFVVQAYKLVDGTKVTVSIAKTVHIVTSGGKKASAKGIKFSKAKATLKKGKTLNLKASEIKNKKPLPRCRKVMFESDNVKIAAVTKQGKVTAKAKGKCTIYIYAQNGLYKQVKIVVK